MSRMPQMFPRKEREAQDASLKSDEGWWAALERMQSAGTAESDRLKTNICTVRTQDCVPVWARMIGKLEWRRRSADRRVEYRTYRIRQSPSLSTDRPSNAVIYSEPD